ncbi:MAG TPA: hypothetical protein VKR31_09025 [Rhizomicrobium sp.]|nr:hypothetical protein [Rhizomicrobium sp.]
MKLATAALSAALVLGLANSAAAHMRATDLLNFNQQSGYGPWSGIVTNDRGTLFGTNNGGGTGPCDGGAGCGTIYALSPPKKGGGSWTLNVLYDFQNAGDGSFPEAPVTLGPKGSLFGYPAAGSYGTVFQLVPPGKGGGNWSYNVLYTFNGANGNLLYVIAPLVWSGGALYGIASGGSTACGQIPGCGSVFRLRPDESGNWTEKTLFGFTGGSTGGEADSIVASGEGPSLYVATIYGNGAVVELAPSGHGAWTETVLTTFHGGKDGRDPGNLVVAPDGTIYGTAAKQVFQLVNTGGTWTRTNIAEVAYHGYGPASLALGPNGTLIGVTDGDVDFYPGNVFQLTPSNGTWSLKQLWSFNNGPDRNPVGVTTGLGGHLFGVLNGGDSDNGSVFELK